MTAQACQIYPTYYPYGDLYPQPQTPAWPTHVTHSWQSWMGIGPDPMKELAGAMNRLAAALEKYNEARVKPKRKPKPGKPKPGC